ncbi:phage terminase large subunit [Sphingomonas sp.]|uniref:phage terminase large subunit n=1 Tax=Sphingomonas sp. TaxID=28214 RepID=UPI003F72D293
MTAQLTPRQREANRLLAGPARNIMLRGGSRSGKTFLLVRAIIQRAINAPNSRHAIFRFRFNHAKTSIWADTMPKVLKLCFPSLRARFDKTDFYLELPNGSQIWIAGLDDKERVEKILGAEYVTLYFNESSQIPWGSIETAMSRLAQKCELAPEIAAATGRTYLALKAYFDCNPPSKLHWSYQLFRSKLKPGTKEPVPNPDDYAEMKVNPADNADNLPAEYFEVLAGMSSAKRLRFEAGEWASEVNGALWSLETRKSQDGRDMPGIDTLRVAEHPDLRRVVVAVDPSGTKGDGGGDDIGIIAVGLGVDGHEGASRALQELAECPAFKRAGPPCIRERLAATGRDIVAVPVAADRHGPRANDHVSHHSPPLDLRWARKSDSSATVRATERDDQANPGHTSSPSARRAIHPHPRSNSTRGFPLTPRANRTRRGRSPCRSDAIVGPFVGGGGNVDREHRHHLVAEVWVRDVARLPPAILAGQPGDAFDAAVLRIAARKDDALVLAPEQAAIPVGRCEQVFLQLFAARDLVEILALKC